MQNFKGAYHGSWQSSDDCHLLQTWDLIVVVEVEGEEADWSRKEFCEWRFEGLMIRNNWLTPSC